MVVYVWGLSYVGCCLCDFKIDDLGQGFCYLLVSHFFIPHFGVSAWCLYCTEHMGCNGGDVQ
jgi:hypothetical protein